MVWQIVPSQSSPSLLLWQLALPVRDKGLREGFVKGGGTPLRWRWLLGRWSLLCKWLLLVLGGVGLWALEGLLVVLGWWRWDGLLWWWLLVEGLRLDVDVGGLLGGGRWWSCRLEVDVSGGGGCGAGGAGGAAGVAG